MPIRDLKSRLSQLIALFAALTLSAAPVQAATLVYHSQNDDGLVASSDVPQGPTRTVFLYVDGGATASGVGTACNTGTGDEVCGFTIELNGLTGITLTSFTPDPGANLLVNLSANTIRVNGLDTQTPTPGPHRLGELIVGAGLGGELELTSGEVVGAGLASEALTTSIVVTVPEPSVILSLATGSLLLARMQRRRAGR